MEKRLIDANALIKEICSACALFLDKTCDGKRTSCYPSSIVRKQKTVDAMPVVHGYNKQFEFPSMFTCSVCGWESWDTYCGDTDTYNYCPNCGAKMMKGEQG